MENVSRIEKFSFIAFCLATIGVTTSLWGGSWDVTAHLLRTPETFFTPSHMILYAGVGISVLSAILSAILFVGKKTDSSLSFGLKLVILGTIVQVIAGPGDFFWHEAFGIDGLLSPTHLALITGMLMTVTGAVFGFARMKNPFASRKIISVPLAISFGIFWLNSIWIVHLFVLPISTGETHDFNPDPYVALGLSFAILPFVSSIIFWSIAKRFAIFGAASASMLVFLTVNITSNITTAEQLTLFYPWFIAPMILSLVADYVMTRSKISHKISEKISGALIGSMFFMLSFPMIGMTFLTFYVTDDVLAYDVIHTSEPLVAELWLKTIPIGAAVGVLATMIASRKIVISR